MNLRELAKKISELFVAFEYPATMENLIELLEREVGMRDGRSDIERKEAMK